jgi:uncharacterized protein YceK
MNPDASKFPRTHAAWVVVTLAVLVCASGCATYREDRKQDALEAATTAYAAALRWGYYETAMGYLHPEKRKVAEVPKSLRNIRVTGYYVVQPPVPVGDNERVQVVRIDYVHEDVQSVRSLTDRQTWRYERSNKIWWLDTGLPAFK